MRPRRKSSDSDSESDSPPRLVAWDSDSDSDSDSEEAPLKGTRPNGPKKFVQMQCRRKNVEEALDWLMKYSPAYKGVRKSRENLALLPGVRCVYATNYTL